MVLADRTSMSSLNRVSPSTNFLSASEVRTMRLTSWRLSMVYSGDTIRIRDSFLPGSIADPVVFQFVPFTVAVTEEANWY